MNSRYILQSILINKETNKITDALQWLLKNYKTLKMNQFDEDDNYLIITQHELSKNYFPILKQEINENLGIYFLYYSNTIFPTPAMLRHEKAH